MGRCRTAGIAVLTACLLGCAGQEQQDEPRRETPREPRRETEREPQREPRRVQHVLHEGTPPAGQALDTTFTLHGFDESPTNVKVLVPGLGEFTEATAQRSGHTLLVTSDPAARTAKIEFQLAPGQPVQGETVTFDYELGGRQQASVRLGN